MRVSGPGRRKAAVGSARCFAGSLSGGLEHRCQRGEALLERCAAAHELRQLRDRGLECAARRRAAGREHARDEWSPRAPTSSRRRGSRRSRRPDLDVADDAGLRADGDVRADARRTGNAAHGGHDDVLAVCTLWPICTRLSIFVPRPMRSCRWSPRSTQLLAPISTRPRAPRSRPAAPCDKSRRPSHSRSRPRRSPCPSG